MSDPLQQNPFAPPRAAVQDDVGLPLGQVVDATRMQRLLAVLVDSAVGLAALILLGIVIAATVGLGAFTHAGTGADFASVFTGVVWLSGLLFVLALGWGIYNLVLVYRYGQVFGKRIVGIRVVRSDGSRASLPRILFLRWGLLYVIAFVTGIVATFLHAPALANLLYLVDTLLIFRASRLCLHDQLGDTRVVTAASSEHATLAGLRGAAAPARA
jgi:uncharacterized RDD family membrane protein YckC